MLPSNSKPLQEHINRVRAWNVDAGHLDPENWVEDWVGDEDARELSVALVEEEDQEMTEAVEDLRKAVMRDAMDGTANSRFAEIDIMDAAADILFTLFGLLSKAGLADYLEPVFEEVCRSNDTKLIEPVLKPNGKVGKNPEHFEEPQIGAILGIVTE